VDSRLLAGALIVIIIIVAGVAYYAASVHGGSSTTSAGESGTSQGSTITGTPSGTAGGGKYVIRAATLLGGISTLDIIEAENLTLKYGYPLKVLRLQKTPDILAAIEKGDADLAVVPAEMAARLIESGTNVVIVAVDMLQNQAVLAKDPSINSIRDLQGKLVGAVVASGTYKLFKAYVSIIYGIPVVESGERKPGAIAVVNVPPGNILDAVESGQVDAIVIWEPFVSKGLARGLHIVESFSSLWNKANVTGDPVMLVWIARKDFASQHPDALDAFLKARSEAARLWVENKTLTFRVLASLYHLNDSELAIMYNRTVVVAGGLTDELISSIRDEWWLAWRGGYLPKNPEEIPDSVFYHG
jgi:NitT/TauT family transport system substrate-binding protein